MTNFEVVFTKNSGSVFNIGCSYLIIIIKKALQNIPNFDINF